TLIKFGLWKEHHAGYNEWIKARLQPGLLKAEYDAAIRTLHIKPKISIVMPVYNPQVDYLRAAINSITDQSYNNWELCISDDVSPNPEVKILLDELRNKDERIKVVFRAVNGHISANSNSALSLATGSYLLF